MVALHVRNVLQRVQCGLRPSSGFGKALLAAQSYYIAREQIMKSALLDLLFVRSPRSRVLDRSGNVTHRPPP